MGFGEADATEAAKRVIVAFRDEPTSRLSSWTRSGDSGGGGVRAPKPRAYADGARAPREDCERFFEAAIDLTGEPSPDAPPAEEAPGGAAADGKAKRRSSSSRRRWKPNDANDSMRNDGNDLMRRLAAERRARDAAGGPRRPAGSRRCLVQPPARERGGRRRRRRRAGGSRGGLTGAAARAAATAAVSSAFGGSGIIDALLAGTSEPLKAPLKEVRVLTYNVWFAEHVALADRVQGLSDVVVRSDPHVLCLQEVTPNILMLLHAMPWFEAYKCTPPPAQQYFTVVLFKQSLHKKDKTTRLVRRNFPGSNMGG